MFRKILDSLKQKSSDTVASERTAVDMRIGIGNAGIELAAGGHPIRPSQLLVPDPRVNQSSPHDVYVYAHIDASGKIFYIGRGSGRRAWSQDRDQLWHHYVDRHLHGQYSVRILADDLSAESAETVEGRWMDQENEGLVNRQNMARRIDLEALNRRDALMARNKELLGEAKGLEATDREKAIALYKEALDLLKQYAGIPIETGLFAKLCSEHVAENGPLGQIALLDRLTLCLVRAGRSTEAQKIAEEYFGMFKAERFLTAAQAILKRVARPAGKRISSK